MKKRKILFLGESYRADAITWMKGLKEFGDFEIITWELQTPNSSRLKRILEYLLSSVSIQKTIRKEKPDMVIAERTTSYGFLAALSGSKTIAIAQQGRTDLWPETSVLYPFKKFIQKYAFKKANLIHAWGPVMAVHMKATGVDMNKVLVLPKGIDLTLFTPSTNTSNKIEAIVTRSLQPEYRHDSILKAFGILNQKGIDFSLTIVGDGTRLQFLKDLAKELQIENKVIFTGRIPNTELPKLLQQSNIYISMPITEGVSASLFEAMACNCYPVVSDIPGNQSWITHRENGQLIEIDNIEMLAEELIWSFENSELRNQAIIQNRKFVEENANYDINMKVISEKYHELLNLTPLTATADTQETSAHFINNLDFQYIETYTFQRGKEFEETNLSHLNEYNKLIQRKIKKNDLDYSQELRLKELEKLRYTQYILDNEGKFHSSAHKTNTFRFDDQNVAQLKKILNIEVINRPDWMCGPKYRDAIIFYNKKREVVSSLNICFSCHHMQTIKSNYINADESTYNLLKEFFIKIGHDIE